TFTIYLPAVSSTETVAPEVPQTGSAVRVARIMVMDDEEMLRDVAQAQLTTLGHEAVLVADGEQAINEYQKLQDSGTPVDLVIMDLTIPGGMGGQEAAKRLLQIDPRAKIIVASGYSNDPVMAGYRDYGFRAAIAKPFDLAELSKGIESALS
ncbi:MAG: response regulator, partial [Thermodesulfobacteriota bacterium]|nr:response regulator [Thermodesulfobacteriota bacterium]